MYYVLTTTSVYYFAFSVIILLLKCFLIGTQPISKKTVYRCIYMYKEMESDGFLTRGPIDLQYKEYLKSEKYLHKKRAQDKIASTNIN